RDARARTLDARRTGAGPAAQGTPTLPGGPARIRRAPRAEVGHQLVDYDFGGDADALRAELRALIAEEIPEDFLGAFTDDPRDLEIAQRFCARLASDKLLTLAWPEEYGGRHA